VLPTDASNPIRVSVVGLKKQYPGTLAVDLDLGQRLDFWQGEIHALVGENGAGKSTLVSMLAGTTAPTGGLMYLDGQPYSPVDVVGARARGVDIVLQEPGLVDTMTVEENLLLGREREYAPHWVFRPAMRRRIAAQALAHVHRRIPFDALAGDLNLEDQKFVELARALSLGPKVLIIDEMTASLSESGVPELFELLRAFASSGGTVIYISHYLEEVAALCDRVTVMRDGRHVATIAAASTTEDELSLLMVGRSVKETMFREDTRANTGGEVLLEVRDLSVSGRFVSVSLAVHSGEVVGIGGLVGCGSESLALALFGDLRPASGEVRLRGRTVAISAPGEAILNGINLVPGDREREGLILNLSLERNIGLPAVRWLQRLGFISRGAERRMATRLIGEMRIVARGTSDTPMSLSGGNRQKVVLAKWLTRQPTLLILHNPTRGVDVAGKADIYGIVRALADQGVGIILISDDLPELIGLSDTLMIMRRGRVSATVSRDSRPTEEALIGYML
jgi:ABC-type sugar transport system ATPase subunit